MPKYYHIAPQQSERLNSILHRAVQDGVAPAISLAVTNSSQSMYEQQVGALTFDPLSPACHSNVYFDLASLTKPLITALWFWTLEENGFISRDDQINKWVDCTDRLLKKATIKSLLNHSSGLPAHREYCLGLASPRMNGRHPSLLKDQVRRMIRHTEIEYVPHSKSIYSDLGFLLLEWICEIASGQTINQFWDSHQLNQSLRKKSHDFGLHFRPLLAVNTEDMSSPSVDTIHVMPNKVVAQSVHESRVHFCSQLNRSPSFAPTEQCHWRKKYLISEVHDDNAWLMGGVCGHAGLFGRAIDVSRFAQALMNAYHDRENLLGVSSSYIRDALSTEHKAPRGSHVMGWDTPSIGYSSAGKSFSLNTIGHLGFTGTSLWIDLDREVAITILTNRVFPNRDRNSSGIKVLRPQLHDAIWSCLNHD